MLSEKIYNLRFDIDKLKVKVSKVIEEFIGNERSFEDEEMLIILDNFVDRLECKIDDLKYFNWIAKEGYLEKMYNDKFSINGQSLGCGSSLEICIDDTWYIGRVEHKDGAYYFYNSECGYPQLYDGMKARKRNVGTYWEE